MLPFATGVSQESIIMKFSLIIRKIKYAVFHAPIGVITHSEIKRMCLGNRKLICIWNCPSPGQYCCRCASQISKWCDYLKYQSCGFETSWDLTIRRLIRYWNGALVLSLLILQNPDFSQYWHWTTKCSFIEQLRMVRTQSRGLSMVIFFTMDLSSGAKTSNLLH